MVLVCGTTLAVTAPVIKFKPGDRSRPFPVKVKPGEPGTRNRPGSTPSDAVALFNGKDLLNWKQLDGNPVRWKVGDGYFEVAPGTGDIQTRDSFGDCQMHVEWATPRPSQGTDQEVGNSGVWLMSLYEVQILDSFENVTYPDGQAGAIYCQYPPLVNASLPSGEWQTYDIVFHGPRFGPDGNLRSVATLTVFHNGILLQDHTPLTGPSTYMKRPPYKVHPPRLPLMLQDHDQPVRFRNIWIRELGAGNEGESSRIGGPEAASAGRGHSAPVSQAGSRMTQD